MKKILVLLILFLAIKFTHAQMNIWYSKNDTSVFTKGDTVYPGDSSWVYVKYEYTTPPYHPNGNDTAWLYINNLSNTYLFLMRKIQFSDLDKIKKVHTPNEPPDDSCIIIKFKVPIECPTGPAQLIAKNRFPIYIKGSTGIQEYSQNKKIKSTEYYSVDGRQLSGKVKDNIYIERIIFTDGSFYCKKKYTME